MWFPGSWHEHISVVAGESDVAELFFDKSRILLIASLASICGALWRGLCGDCLLVDLIDPHCEISAFSPPTQH